MPRSRLRRGYIQSQPQDDGSRSDIGRQRLRRDVAAGREPVWSVQGDGHQTAQIKQDMRRRCQRDQENVTYRLAYQRQRGA